MKPLVSGSAIDASVMIRNAAHQLRHHRLEAAELRDQAGVAAVREHADDHEQPAGADAVVEHLQTAPCTPWMFIAHSPSTTNPRWLTLE